MFYRAYVYCEYCHKDVTVLSKIKKCKCHKGIYLSNHVIHEQKTVQL